MAKIVKNFENKPEIPEDIPDIVKDMIYDKLPTDLKFEKAAKYINNQNQWKRCVLEKYKTCEISEHNYNYKQA